jgi:hypothetical protein
MKAIYYGDFDSGFIRAIEALIEYENSKKVSSRTKTESSETK